MKNHSELVGGVTLATLERYRQSQNALYPIKRPKAAEHAINARSGFVNGVPMQWMTDWPLPYPLIISQANGASLTDIDGNQYADFCLGDTGAMFGHSPESIALAVQSQAQRGFTHMLPTADAAIVSELLAQTFGLPVWQIALTATDANRFALRLARTVTNRPKILVFHGCYHGTVDETFVRLKHGKAVHRPGLMGQFTDLTAMTEVVEFNDIDSLRDALEKRDVACVITEPVLTNSSMVLPDPGFHDALRSLTRETETLLLIDETHTISSGYGGYTRVFGLEPDIWVCGKAIAGGVPTAVWGMTREVASQYEQALLDKESGHSGMGTTLSANALSLTALRASLEHVMTRANYRHMETLAGTAEERLRQVIERHKMPWHVIRVGARVELIFSEKLLKNGTEAEKTHLPELEGAIHIGLLNQGVLIAPFHNMMLISPKTTLEDVDRLVNALDNVLRELSVG